MLNNPFQRLEKLEIQIFKDRMRTGLPLKTFKAQLNPTSYVQNHETKFDCIEGLGKTSREKVFMYTKPESLALDLILDATGTTDLGLPFPVPGAASALVGAIGSIGKRGVADKVEALKNAAMELDSRTHEPAYLKVRWGVLDFDCRMEKMSVRYTLFDRAGVPLRAELSVLFNHDMDGKRAGLRDKLNSPDLTHERVVRAGDTLPLLSKEIYGTPDRYPMIARANGLDNFRKLEVGSTLRFPPLAS